MENSATSTLTPEQRERIEQNRLKALEKLKTKRKATNVAETGSSDDVKKPLPKRSRWTKYYEYDLSTMVDSKAGFIVEDTLEDDKVKSRREETAKIVQFIPMSADPTENPKCRDCGSMDIDPTFFQVFNLSVCRACRDKFPERYSLITKTEAKEDYLLTDPELRDTELLPHWSKPNPRKATWNNMMLYVREMVEQYAFKKWGGEQGLDAEYERREAQKKEKKDKKFKEKLADLRRRTMTSSWERKRQQGPHKHTFGSPVEDPETGITTQKCQECGLIIESEEF
ncbi:hypothetical protein VTP01DRAFT_1011 [Rhizomucor pusillus]|uniref:uncharacterized protein n=1 Tax=Rhizomucor pusillus TaxID=4840 RepID=UPI0037431E97